ncbi:MAG TPA: hypothetical protein VM094_02125 [Gemmatimonadales bacterium]|nr:hypothetical protein [Gemmatimonadales bacterium]
MESKAPILGVVSISLAILMAALWILFERVPQLGNGLNGYLGMFMLAFLYVGTVMAMGAGFILAVASLVRRERSRLLGVLGVTTNMAIVLWIFG